MGHMVTKYLHIYKSLQLLTNFICVCELPTKCSAIVSNNNSNDNGNMSRSFITILGQFYAKHTMLPLSD
jgi:hypothetical protein